MIVVTPGRTDTLGTLSVTQEVDIVGFRGLNPTETHGSSEVPRGPPVYPLNVGRETTCDSRSPGRGVDVTGRSVFTPKDDTASGV